MLDSTIFIDSLVTWCYNITFSYHLPNKGNVKTNIISYDRDYEMRYKVFLKLNKAILSYKIDILKSKQNLCLGKTLLRLSSVILVMFWKIDNNEYK